MSSENDTCINVCLLGISGKAGDLLKVWERRASVKFIITYVSYFILTLTLCYYLTY